MKLTAQDLFTHPRLDWMSAVSVHHDRPIGELADKAIAWAEKHGHELDRTQALIAIVMAVNELRS